MELDSIFKKKPKQPKNKKPKSKFARLQAYAAAYNLVLERDRRTIDGENYAYSVYNNNDFTGDICKNLSEARDVVYSAVEQLKNA